MATGTLCGAALNHGGRIIIPDTRADVHLKNSESLRSYDLCGIRAVQSTPLTTREGRVIGMISTHWREPHVPEERELRRLDVLARLVTDFIERRQTVDFAIPGDHCDLNLFILDRMDHSIAAITKLKVAEIAPDDFFRFVANNPNITTALWWQELVSKSIHREWIVNVGQRTAQERIGHLFCEIFLRLETVGLTIGFTCDFPPTQTDIAEATGLTPVHVNRTIQELRRQGLVMLDRTKLTIPNMLALHAASLFNADYLHHRRLNRHTEHRRNSLSRLEGTHG